MSAYKKIKVISPDGFTIDFSINFYRSYKKAKEAFDKWRQRYITQGYYSSTQYGRIPLEDLEDYCTFIDITKQH